MRTQVFAVAALLTLAGSTVPGQAPPPQAAAPQAPTAQPSPPQAATQPPTFKVEVNYVEVDAVVTDAQGNFVGDLTRDDFQVVEEGKPQTVSAFTRVDIPIEREDPPLFRQAAIEPDVRSNRDAFTGRVFLMVLDDLQTVPLRTMLVRAAARQFIRRSVGANDMVAVVTTGGNASAGQEFTSSRPRLLAAVEKFMGQKTRRDAPDMERGFRARNTYATLSNLADYMAGIRGRRKAIVWFGEGVDYNIDNDRSPHVTPDVVRIGHAGRDCGGDARQRELLRRRRPRRRRGARRSHRDLRRPRRHQQLRRRSRTRCAGRRTACGSCPKRPAASRSSTRTT